MDRNRVIPKNVSADLMGRAVEEIDALPDDCFEARARKKSFGPVALHLTKKSLEEVKFYPASAHHEVNLQIPEGATSGNYNTADGFSFKLNGTTYYFFTQPYGSKN